MVHELAARVHHHVSPVDGAVIIFSPPAPLSHRDDIWTQGIRARACTAPGGAGDTLTMLVKLAPPTLSDLLLPSAWFLPLASAAQHRLMEDV